MLFTQRQWQTANHLNALIHQICCRGKNQVSLMNIMMHLRKACNHAELVGDMDEDEYETYYAPALLVLAILLSCALALL